MPQSKRWLDEIVEVLTKLGGHAKYKDIYDLVESRGNMDLSGIGWQATVRRTIEYHSSDSQVFLGKEDYFFAVEGIGKGHWGLRDYYPTTSTVDLTEDDSGYSEGKLKLQEHICRERNPRVIKLAKERFKELHGRLFCEACSFDFADKYGEIGDDYIEGHHVIPIKNIPEGYKTKVDDIILLCANCHRMIHRKTPWLTRDNLSELFIKQTHRTH